MVDDHQMLREALVGMLELSGFEVVGTVADGADATSMAAELAPDVVLMDLSHADPERPRRDPAAARGRARTRRS